jgi:hypothetical protein
VPRLINRFQLDGVQRHMSSFYRLNATMLEPCVYMKYSDKFISFHKLTWNILINSHASSRNYGKWVARNPTLVLCSSVAVVLVLCIGLICFKVETRPEKVSHWNLFVSYFSREFSFWCTLNSAQVNQVMFIDIALPHAYLSFIN